MARVNPAIYVIDSLSTGTVRALPETRTPDPLIKSQIQSGPEPNID